MWSFFHRARGGSRLTFLAVLHEGDGLQLRLCGYTSESLMDKNRKKKLSFFVKLELDQPSVCCPHFLLLSVKE